jgi:copper chaperone CopZ
MQTLTLSITGMSCGHCVRAVRDALAQLPGVSVGQVQIGSATIDYDSSLVAVGDVTQAIEDAGYAAEAAAR